MHPHTLELFKGPVQLRILTADVLACLAFIALGCVKVSFLPPQLLRCRVILLLDLGVLQLELLNHGGLSRQFLFHLLHHAGLLRLARVAVFDLDLKQIDLLQRLSELMLQGADLGLLNLDRLRLLALFLEYLLEAFDLG